MSILHRRDVLRGTAALAGAAALPAVPRTSALSEAAATGPAPLRFACKIGMVSIEGSLTDKFKLLADIGYNGVELDSPNSLDLKEVRAAQDASGLPVHGVVNSIHWSVRLSDPDRKVRREAVQGLTTAVRDAKSYGASSVLLVPGLAADPEHENQEQVFSRSIEGIREVLPLAAELGVRILIENVWNRFAYQHDGPDDQTADALIEYLDAIGSPWVGSYFDIGNHQKYGKPGQWIRSLGSRIVKLDVKDWGKEGGFGKIGEGDVDWADVRLALSEIGYEGWATAEVGGGDESRLSEVLQRMRVNLYRK